MKDWEAHYRAGDTPWDRGEAAPPLRELMERKGREIWGCGPILVPGCGLGHDVRVLAELGLPVVGLDIAETAVRLAEGFPRVGEETYEAGDFLRPSWRKRRKVSAIWEHTCFCAIDPGLRDAYARAAAAVLPEGGVLAGVFYLKPSRSEENESGPPFEVSTDELDRLFAPWFEREDGWIPQRTYPGREGREWVGIFRRLPA